MSERDVTMLLDRVAEGTPALDVSVPEVVRVGRRRVRRRRAVEAGGMTFAALALVGTVVWGTGGGPTGRYEITPAGSWQVEERAPVQLPDGLAEVGGVRPLTLVRSAAGSELVLEVDGDRETVVGGPLPGGGEVFVGRRATVLVWKQPRGAAPDPDVLPVQDGEAGSAEVRVDGEELVLWATTDAGYRPQGVVLHDDDRVWTLDGEVAQTVQLRADDVHLTGFELPGLGLTGYLDRGSLVEVDALTVSSVDRSWWRGGHDVVGVARLPEQAVFAREVLRDDPEGVIVETGELRTTAGLDGADLVLFVSDWLGGQGTDRVAQVQWSADGRTWHDQDTGAPTATDVEPGPVGPGGKVVLLGEIYDVAVDDQGWPMLLEPDGTTFLQVTDDVGPSEGGVVYLRDGFWPWSPSSTIRFRVDTAPRDRDGVVTISGPEGFVMLEPVPAGAP